jgi:parallel beta-helix repeat protein
MNFHSFHAFTAARGAAAGAVMLALASAAAYAETLTVNPGESIQAAVTQAKPGDTIRVLPGTYKETVFIDKDNIRLSGVVTEGKWPVLDGEGKLNDGILASGHGTVIERMWVRHFKGNGIMTQGANNYQIVHNVVEGPTFYAIFPQFGRNGLVAHNIVTKSDDAAIYVGMSDGVDVLYNETAESIIGIETENSLNTLIEGNYVHDNVMGIAATNLPGLPIKRAENLVIRNNYVVRNNTANFAPPGAITAGAPSGLGILVLGTDATVVENNLIRDNKSAGVLVAETTLFVTTPDAKLDPFPDRTQILRNTYINNGFDPQDAVKGVLEVAGLGKGVDVLSSGKGRDNCIAERDAITSLGIKKFADCAPDATTAATLTMRPPKLVEAPKYTAEQMGRMTYLAVCTGCHTYDSKLVGPPMIAVKALYANNAKGLADWIAHPTKKRPEYPEMPPQNYLSEDVRMSVANYILTELSH